MNYNSTGFFPKFDPKIYWSFGVLLCLGIFLFIFQCSRHVDCQEANFYAFADNYAVKEVIEFGDKTKNAKSWKWDFGDGSPADFRQRTFHTYEKTGEYVVTLTINGSCTSQKVLTITSLNQQVGYLPTIKAPDVVFLGETTKFIGQKQGGISFEWSFGETSATDAVGDSVTYKFKRVGQKKITLIVNGDLDHIATKTIYVAPKHVVAKEPIDMESYVYEQPHSNFSLPMGKAQKDPLVDMLTNIPVAPKAPKKEDTPPSAKKVPDISNEQFILLLNGVASQAKTKDDFKDYLCENYQVPVVINDDKIVPFAQFCKEISGKKVKIENLRLQKDVNNACIQNIYVYYKVKGKIFWKKG